MNPTDRLHPLLRERINDRLGWSDLRPAQKLAIAPILDGHNTIVLAPTAGGKTEAAFFPVLSAVHVASAPPVSVLYLSPLKALLNNQEPRLRRLAAMVDRTVFRWHGDVADGPKDGFVREPADILLITPESLEGLFLGRKERLFSALKMVVIDEVHAFAGTDRGAHLLSLLDRVAACTGGDLQRIALSATVGNPAALLAWLSGASKREQVVVDPPRSGIQRFFTLRAIPDASPADVAAAAAPFLFGRRTMFFVDARKTAEALRPALAAEGVSVEVHHASIDRRLRESAELAVQALGVRGKGRPQVDNIDGFCLLCTSTMELGVDVGDLDAVVQLDAPASVASYLQRMGRSGRRGEPGRMVVLADDREGFLRAIALTELARRRWVEPVRLSSRCWSVYVHQILALLLAKGMTDTAALFDKLHPCAAFSDIRRAEFDALMDHLCTRGLLERVRHRVRLGYEAEKAFGDRNFSALCSVFEGGAPQMTVMSGGEAVGTIDRSYAKALLERKPGKDPEASSGNANSGQPGSGKSRSGNSGAVSTGEFSLAGQAWRTERVDWKSAKLHVSAGAEGGVPRWRGASRPVLAAEVALEMRDLLVGSDVPSYLDPPEQQYLERLRGDARASGLDRGEVPIEPKRGGWLFWTLAGERTNRALGILLSDALNCAYTATWERFYLYPQARRGKLPVDDAIALLAAWSTHGFSPTDRSVVLAGLPDQPESRFAKYLPRELAAEQLASDQVDLVEAAIFLAGVRFVRQLQGVPEIQGALVTRFAAEVE